MYSKKQTTLESVVRWTGQLACTADGVDGGGHAQMMQVTGVRAGRRSGRRAHASGKAALVGDAGPAWRARREGARPDPRA